MNVSENIGRILDALFTINKVAKNYSEDSQDAYKSGFKAQAKELSLRKDAIYRYKSHILKDLYEKGLVERVTEHQIKDEDFYCFVFNNYSFHSPVDDIDDFEISVDSSENITDDFSSESVSEEKLPMTEREALKCLEDAFCSANKFVWPKIFNGNYTSRSLGWSFLDGYYEKGDRVSENEFEEIQEKYHMTSNFGFNQGDLFDTFNQGEVQIIDRFGLWSEPFRSYHTNDNVSCRPAYDVIVNGELKENILEERITRDWWIDIQDTNKVDGVTRISGNAWSKYTIDNLDGLPRIREGDTVVFDDGETATIDGIYTNDFVIVFFILSWDSGDFNEHFAADEFLQDVVEIERDSEVLDINWEYNRSDSSESELDVK